MNRPRTLLGVLLIAFGVSSCLGCATIRAHSPFRNPDGTLNVMKVLQFVQYGIDADCQFATTAVAESVCEFGRPAVAGAMAVANRDPRGAVPAVISILVELEARVPAVTPYVDWAIKVLQGKIDQ